MTALAADRKITIQGDIQRYRNGKLAAVKVYKGAALCRNTSGYLTPAADTRGFKFVGWAAETVDNSAGAAGDKSVKYFTGCSAKMKNDGTSPVTQAALFGPVYIKDDQTVQLLPSNGVVAGIAESIEDDGEIMVYASSDACAGISTASSPPETIIAAGALSLYSRTSLIATVGAIAITLAAGLYAGQRKTIRMTADGGDATLTAVFVTDTVNTTTATFGDVTDQLELEWNGTRWQVLQNTGVTLA